MPKGRFAHLDKPTVAEMRAKARAGASSVNTWSPNGSGFLFFSGVLWPAPNHEFDSDGR